MSGQTMLILSVVYGLTALAEQGIRLADLRRRLAEAPDVSDEVKAQLLADLDRAKSGWENAPG